MKSYTKRPKRKLGLIVLFIIVLLAVGTTTSVYLIRKNYLQQLKPISSGEQQTPHKITIASGSSAKQIAIQLESAGLIRKSWAFEWYLRQNDLRDKILAGTYELSSSQSTQEIAGNITEGKVVTNLITILPGQRIDEIKKRFLKNGFDQKEIDIAFDQAGYINHPALVDKPKQNDLEGYLYPDSYQITASTKVSAIVKNALDLMAKALTPEVRAGFAKQGIGVYQGVTLASIVEKEENKLDERPKVAQVFLSRNKIGMELGSDVTAFYGSARAGRPDIQDVFYDSPYNTRIHKGFPPGPIGTVSATSLKSVAEPSSTDFLFFVAGDNGKTYFSKTLEEHERLANEHCKKLCNR